MPKLISRILVINDEHLVLREFVKVLNAAARTLDNPLGISFTGVATAKEALALIESDVDLQAVLVDDTLYSLARNNHKKQLQMSALELVQRITRFRPELDVYILIAQEKEDDVVDKLFTNRWMATSTARSATTAASTASSTPRSRSVRARRSTTS